jgi:hypothetical protein
LEQAFFEWFFPLVLSSSLVALLGTAVKRKAESATLFGIATVLMFLVAFVILSFGFTDSSLWCNSQGTFCVTTDVVNYLLIGFALFSDASGVIVLIRSLND